MVDKTRFVERSRRRETIISTMKVLIYTENFSKVLNSYYGNGFTEISVTD